MSSEVPVFEAIKTEFPQNPLSALHLYTALYASNVETIILGNQTMLNVVNHCNLYPGSIRRRNTEYMEVYFCGPLTSAGAIRIPDNAGKAFEQNTAVAEIFRDALIPQLEKESMGMDIRLTLPGLVGLRDHEDQNSKWGEENYNLFWLFYLSGIDPVSAMLFDKKESTKYAVDRINDKKIPRELRRPAFQDLVDDFIAFAKNPKNGCRLNKMSKVVTLPDSENSFGSQMEIKLAKGLGITVEEAKVNPEWIKNQDLWFNKYSGLNQLERSNFVLHEDSYIESVSLNRIV